MTTTLDARLRGELLEQLARAPALVCFLDYDGTLVPFASRPELALPTPQLLEILRRLARLPRVRVSIVSGRRAADLQRFLPVGGLSYVGVHGAELLTADGKYCVCDPARAAQPWIAEGRRKLELACTDLPGVWIEDKTYSLACHVRQAPTDVQAAAEQRIARVHDELAARGAPLELLRGHLVYELRPRGVNKGLAALRVLRDFRSDALCLYAGDDATDEDAFRLLPRTTVTIRVSAEASGSAARYRVPGPSDLLALLEDLVCRRQADAGTAT